MTPGIIFQKSIKMAILTIPSGFNFVTQLWHLFAGLGSDSSYYFQISQKVATLHIYLYKYWWCPALNSLMLYIRHRLMAHFRTTFACPF